MENYFIINPVSGKGKSADYIPIIKENKENHIYVTSKKGEAESFARSISSLGSEVSFFAVGGDGTLNEVINGIAGYKNARAGIVPAGTGNDFVRCFKNKERFRSINAQINGTEIIMDTAEAIFDNRIGTNFINMANIGFDCNVVINTNTIKKKYASGSFAYILGAVQEMAGNWGNDIRISFDDGYVYDNSHLLCTIANGHYCGGGFCSSPYAELSDGYLDVAIVDKISKLKLISMLKGYRDGTYLKNSSAEGFITYKRTKTLGVELKNEQGVSVDGEIFYFRKAEFKIKKHSLRFILPAGAAFN